VFHGRQAVENGGGWLQAAEAWFIFQNQKINHRKTFGFVVYFLDLRK
jgi:hypothetical protein